MGNNENKTLKSDMPVYYAASVALLIVACICVILIFKNIFSGPSEGSVGTVGTVTAESVQKTKDTQGIQETEEELKISHAGLPSENEKPIGSEVQDHPVFRSRS